MRTWLIRSWKLLACIDYIILKRVLNDIFSTATWLQVEKNLFHFLPQLLENNMTFPSLFALKTRGH